MRALTVVAGIIENDSGEILLGLRPAHKAEPLKWEFPGGKVRVGESLKTALERELGEELGHGIDVLSHFASVRWREPSRPLNLHAFRCHSGLPIERSAAHVDVRWTTRRRLIDFDVPPADRPVLARLALPSTYFITPEPGMSTIGPYLDRIKRTLDVHAPGIVLLRLPGLSLQELPKWAVALRQTLREHGDPIAILHDQPQLSRDLDFDGLHVTSRRLLDLNDRPIPHNRWLFASCHNQLELRRAQACGVDAVVFGPVSRSRTHPGNPGIGWRRFATHARATWLPVFALGGVKLDELEAARTNGAHGIAGITSFDLCNGF